MKKLLLLVCFVSLPGGVANAQRRTVKNCAFMMSCHVDIGANYTPGNFAYLQMEYIDCHSNYHPIGNRCYAGQGKRDCLGSCTLISESNYTGSISWTEINFDPPTSITISYQCAQDCPPPQGQQIPCSQAYDVCVLPGDCCDGLTCMGGICGDSS